MAKVGNWYVLVMFPADDLEDAMTVADRVRHHLFAEDASDQLRRYFSGRYSGAWFETFEGGGDCEDVANRFVPADLVAVTLLGVRVSGWGAIDILAHRAEDFSTMLQRLPGPEVALHSVEDSNLESLWEIQSALDEVSSVGHVVRSKLLARKRPRLVPVRDQHVLTALTGTAHGDLTIELRNAMREAEIRDRAEQLRGEAGCHHLSLLRVVDVVVWMRVYGAASIGEER